MQAVGWLFWVKRPFETVFQSISGCLPESGRKRRKRTEGSKNVQTTPTCTYCKRNRPLPYYHPNCRTPLHWKFTQDHRTTRPPPYAGRILFTGYIYLLTYAMLSSINGFLYAHVRICLHTFYLHVPRNPMSTYLLTYAVLTWTDIYICVHMLD